MNALDLASVIPGFPEPTADSQGVFRDCLEALSAPGRCVEMCTAIDAVPGIHPASLVLLLAMLDQDTNLWLSPSAAAAAATFRFHTGCRLVDDPAAAHFALAANPQELPALEVFAGGTDEHPERSATLLLQVPAFAGARWLLTGPGIESSIRVAAPDLGDGFVAQWQRNRGRFPRGIDLFLVCGRTLCGLPRTTDIASERG